MPQKQRTFSDALLGFGSIVGVPGLPKPGAAGRRQMNLGHGTVYDSRTGEAFIPDEYQRAIERDRNFQLDKLARRLAAQQEAARITAGRIPESTAKAVAGMQTEADIGQQLSTDYQSALDSGEEIQEPIAGALPAAARSVGLPGAAALYEQVTDTPAAINLRSRISDFIGPYRNARFGASLTGGEQSEWAKVDPLAYGISHEESMKRVANIQDWYAKHAAGMQGNRSMPGAANAPMAPIAAPAAPAATGLQPGTVDGGYRFIGGNPADSNNWEAVQ